MIKVVYKTGMKKMPTRCKYCCYYGHQNNYGWAGKPCCLAYMEREVKPNSRPDWCPLVEVSKHGRLIDADVLMQEFDKAERTMEQHGQEYACSFLSTSQELSTEWYCVEDILDNAPTVIEASEG